MGSDVHTISTEPADSQRGRPGLRPRPGYALAKRLMDLAGAVLLLLALSPVIVIAALAVKLSSRGPVLFQQERIGQHGRPFTLLKFRTMRIGTDDSRHREMNRLELMGKGGHPGDCLHKLQADPRITPVGRFLRAYSIDELPQLLNVLRGDMSLVGPRPSLPWEVELYTPAQRVRELCLPGLTGLWQVSGRSRLSMPQMLALDAEYVHRRSLRLDMLILLRTPAVILAGETR